MSEDVYHYRQSNKGGLKVAGSMYRIRHSRNSYELLLDFPECLAEACSGTIAGRDAFIRPEVALIPEINHLTFYAKSESRCTARIPGWPAL